MEEEVKIITNDALRSIDINLSSEELDDLVYELTERMWSAYDQSLAFFIEDYLIKNV